MNATLLLMLVVAQNEPPQNMLERITALEARVAALESVPKQTAQQRAFAEGKPLVTWMGSSLCPPCVNELQNEVVSDIVPSNEPMIVVTMPTGESTVIRQWVAGRQTFSIRQAIRNLRAARAAPTMMPYRSAPTMMSYRSVPVYRSSGMRMGACASCR